MVTRSYDSELTRNMKASYYNPKDALVNKDPRMKAAPREYAAEMRKKWFIYNLSDEVEADIRERLDVRTGGKYRTCMRSADGGGTIPVERMSPDQLAALCASYGIFRREPVQN